MYINTNKFRLVDSYISVFAQVIMLLIISVHAQMGHHLGYYMFVTSRLKWKLYQTLCETRKDRFFHRVQNDNFCKTTINFYIVYLYF